MTTDYKDEDEGSSELTAEVVSRRAYEKWTARVGPEHGGLQDWLEAEAELLQLRTLTQQVQDLQQQLAEHLAAFEITQSRLSAEREIARILAQSPDLTQAAGPILRSLCFTLGWAVGVMWSVNRSGTELRCTDVFHPPEWDLSEFAETTRWRTFARGEGLPGRVWDSQLPMLIEEVSEDDVFTRAAAASGILRSAVAFPIRVRDDVVGIMEFFSREPVAADDGVAQMIWSVGAQIGLFIERRNAEEAIRRQHQERQVAGEIQRRLLPRSAPSIPGYEISGRCQSALDIGGDCFDYVPLKAGSGESLGVLLADASGHNVGAALLVTEIRGNVRALGTSTADVGHILERVNQQIAVDLGDIGFATAILVGLSADSGAFSYANAGHWPGIVFNADGCVRALLAADGFPLAIEETSRYEAQSGYVLDRGELILLFTDGAIDSCSAEGELFGRDRLIKSVQEHWAERPGRVLEEVFRGMIHFTGGQGLRDDATIVLIKRNGAGQESDRAA